MLKFEEKSKMTQINSLEFQAFPKNRNKFPAGMGSGIKK